VKGVALRSSSSLFSSKRWVLVLLAVLAGCTTETKQTRIAPGVARDEGTQMIMPQKFDADRKPIIPAGPDNPDVNPDNLTDPCAARLHDIGGALLFYYARSHQMPAKLEDLKPLDASLEFQCARNGAAFVYVPEGMAAVGKEKRIIAYDPTPIGRPRFRWCLIAAVSNSGALITDVVPMAENVFSTYQAAPPATDAQPQPPQRQPQPGGQ
jgi:hypothetical protein